VATVLFDTDRTGIKLGSSSIGGLRRENLRLRQLLKKAEETASRYTVMLREGDHRIKNSLQIVSSMMHLQARREESRSAREALHMAAARIRSVAQMHDALQAGDGEDLLDIGTVLEKMCAALHAMGGAPLGVNVRVTADHVKSPIGTAQPLVLAVNELVVNALRHAFPDGRAGSIDVELRCADGELRVIVADDGVGMPAGYAEGEGYGMKLVRTMTAQVNGVLYMDGGPGTRFMIVLPVAQPVAAASNHAAPAAKPRQPHAVLAQAKDAKAPRRQPASALLRKPWSANGRG
jgi:two-component sensor histidine kinase